MVLGPKANAARCRLLGAEREPTLRLSQVWDMVPGEIVTVRARTAPRVTVAIHDMPKNTLERITFFNRSYRRADLNADVAGLGVEASAELIETLVKEHRG